VVPSLIFWISEPVYVIHFDQNQMTTSVKFHLIPCNQLLLLNGPCKCSKKKKKIFLYYLCSILYLQMTS